MTRRPPRHLKRRCCIISRPAPAAVAGAGAGEGAGGEGAGGEAAVGAADALIAPPFHLFFFSTGHGMLSRPPDNFHRRMYVNSVRPAP